MDMTALLAQLLKMQKTASETTFDILGRLQESGDKMLRANLEQWPWIPEKSGQGLLYLSSCCRQSTAMCNAALASSFTQADAYVNSIQNWSAKVPPTSKEPGLQTPATAAEQQPTQKPAAAKPSPARKPSARKAPKPAAKTDAKKTSKPPTKTNAALLKPRSNGEAATTATRTPTKTGTGTKTTARSKSATAKTAVTKSAAAKLATVNKPGSN